ncbi:cell division protein SepF [Streptococcus suis]|uniref:cell division protein SepF n=1 Tax=Streptococcus suis TaxID=1307 RepID=UPI001ABDECF0|nr:cell division protein SepF [Streptococcus suis]
MALKDTFKNFFNYFEMDDSDLYREEVRQSEVKQSPTLRLAPSSQSARTTMTEKNGQQRTDEQPVSRKVENSIQRLNDRQMELKSNSHSVEVKTTIDIKYPKRYEDAPEIVNLLLENASILIDFQYMSDPQARRCLDYLDGARSVLAGNLKKVSNSMWLLTPVNVTVNIEEIRNANHQSGQSDLEYDFDMKR